MITRKLKDNLLIFTFKNPTKDFTNHIYALLDDDQALIIDTGYESNMEELLTYLSKEGISISKVVLTHYHGDHFEGLKLLNDIQIIGSKNYINSIKEFYSDEFINQDKYYPDLYIEDIDSLEHGSFSLRFVTAPGHSYCSFYTIINNEILHASDNIMHTTDGKPILPGPYSSVENHIESLKKLLNYKKLQIIASHSDDELCENVFNSGDITSRINYLEKLIYSDRELTFAEATAESTIDFYNKWHDTNLSLVKE